MIDLYSTIVRDIQHDLRGYFRRNDIFFNIEIVSNVYTQKAIQVKVGDNIIFRGVFIPSPGNVTPIQGLNSFVSSANLILVCADEYRQQMFNALNALSLEWSGQSGYIDSDVDEEPSYSYVVSTSTPSVGPEQIIPGIGQGVTFDIVFNFQFTQYGIIGNSCKWTLDDVALTVLASRTEKTRLINTDQRENDQNLTAIPTAQSKSFKFTLVYTPAIKALVEEMLADDQLDEQHTLTYSDSFVGSKSFTVTAQAIAQNNQPNVVSTLEVVFVLVKTDAAPSTR